MLPDDLGLTARDCRYLRFLGDSDGAPSPSQVAREFGVRLPTAMAALKRLEGMGLIEYRRGEGVRLSREGAAISEELLWRHRVIEAFLFRELGIDPEVACEAASRLEVLLPREAVVRLCERMGHPKACPHGRPIPHPEVAGR